jgi:hypothetical protein
MKFTGGAVTDLLLLLSVVALMFVAYEIGELYNSILTIEEWN